VLPLIRSDLRLIRNPDPIRTDLTVLIQHPLTLSKPYKTVTVPSELNIIRNMSLSKRIESNLITSPIYEFFARALNNAYHETTNPKGIITLGIAENTLMTTELATFLSENLKITTNMFGYGSVMPGPIGMKSGLCKLYNAAPFNPVVTVMPEHIYISAGCGAVLDQLFWGLCDEGEGVLIGRPLYGGFIIDMQARSKATPVAVSLKGLDAFSIEAVARYEEKLIKAEKEGVKVRCLVLCTPHNPLGQ
jgi:aspartate/methionine/tyrosine aminotransferase